VEKGCSVFRGDGELIMNITQIAASIIAICKPITQLHLRLKLERKDCISFLSSLTD